MLTHRPATDADTQRYFEWANDPDTRQQSFQSEIIDWPTHQRWFSRKLTDLNALLLVFANEAGQPVGQVRFERGPDETVIGVSVDAGQRGRGYAVVMLRDAVAVFRKTFPDAPVVTAYIKAENTASVRAFERAGFRWWAEFSAESGKFGVPTVAYRFAE